MATTASKLGLMVRLDTDFETAVIRVTEALKGEGFGVLTEIDVRETLKKKLNAEFRPYKILGACNPALAYRALTVAPEVGLLLPCNVTVAQAEGGTTEVALVDPRTMMSIVDNPALQEVADEAAARLQRVADALRR